MIYRWKHLNSKLQFIGWVQGFAEIADGLITILSLGFYASGIELAVARYRAKLSFTESKK